MHTSVRKIRLLRRLGRIRFLRNFSRSEEGVQLAELAIVLPIFLLLFAATAEFGRFFYAYSTLSKASRAGARYLVSAPIDGSDDAKAKKLVAYGNEAGTGNPVITDFQTTNVTITRTNLGADARTVKVAVTGFKYKPLFDLGKMLKQPALSLNVDLSPSVTMRVLPAI
jgi:Flp pilus assembly protein TadG